MLFSWLKLIVECYIIVDTKIQVKTLFVFCFFLENFFKFCWLSSFSAFLQILAPNLLSNRCSLAGPTLKFSEKYLNIFYLQWLIFRLTVIDFSCIYWRTAIWTSRTFVDSRRLISNCLCLTMSAETLLMGNMSAFQHPRVRFQFANHILAHCKNKTIKFHFC